MISVQAINGTRDNEFFRIHGDTAPGGRARSPGTRHVATTSTDSIGHGPTSYVHRNRDAITLKSATARCAHARSRARAAPIGACEVCTSDDHTPMRTLCMAIQLASCLPYYQSCTCWMWPHSLQRMRADLNNTQREGPPHAKTPCETA